MQRIIIVGNTGAGKTTLAKRLSQRLEIPFVELDALFWGPGWTPVGFDVFRERVVQALSAKRWTACGNYGSAIDLTWSRADTVIWLDYPLWLSLARLFRRTMKRLITREELWAGNRESWRNMFASRDSLFLWALKSYRRHRLRYTWMLTLPEYQHMQVFHFRSPRQAEIWFNQLSR